VVVERAHVPALPVKLLSRPTARRGPLAARFSARLAAEGRRAGARIAHPPRIARSPRKLLPHI
jgi:hypothetical protein